MLTAVKVLSSGCAVAPFLSGEVLQFYNFFISFQSRVSVLSALQRSYYCEILCGYFFCNGHSWYRAS